MFADLFTDVGRRSVPPMIVAVVMVLQRIEGLSDREAVERFAFDARWKYAAGGLDFDYPGFVHTVLVDMRARLARSKRPDRIFEVTLEAAREAGLVGRRRVLDSTPLYDAVATMDTVTLIRSAIRGLLNVADAELEAELRKLLGRDDDYTAAGKPVCDYDDAAARAALVDGLARDAMALVVALDGCALEPEVDKAAALVATVVGQDLDRDADGVFRIARRVAADRVISTVDPQARHGRKTSAHGFDGYKGHIAIDPDSEIVTATEVSAATPVTPSPLPSCWPTTCPRTLTPTRARPATRPPTPVTPSPLPSRWPTTCPTTLTPTRARPMTATMTRTPSPVPPQPRAPTAVRIAPRSTAMRPMVQASFWPGWKPLARRSSRRCSRRPHRTVGSPRTASLSTWTRARSPARTR